MELYGPALVTTKDDGKCLYAKLVVGADGAKLPIREITGLKTTGWNYPQNAIICTVEHSIEIHCAWQRFLPFGPIALLPIGNKFGNIVWTMSPRECSGHSKMRRDDFVKAVNYALDYEPIKVPQKVTDVASERMALRHAREYVSKRVVLIGDAAHVVHPLAAQEVLQKPEDLDTRRKTSRTLAPHSVLLFNRKLLG